MNPYADALAAAVDAAVAPWVARRVFQLTAAAGLELDDHRRRRVEQVAETTRGWVSGELARFLAIDVDRQRSNPLAVLRAAVRFPTALLAELGVPAVRRDPFEEQAFPDDVYGLGPATWRDIDESVHEPGIVWGAWKAKTVLDRRRAEGRR